MDIDIDVLGIEINVVWIGAICFDWYWREYW
jgi:hypothetical protein